MQKMKKGLPKKEGPVKPVKGSRNSNGGILLLLVPLFQYSAQKLPGRCSGKLITESHGPGQFVDGNIVLTKLHKLSGQAFRGRMAFLQDYVSLSNLSL